MSKLTSTYLPLYEKMGLQVTSFPLPEDESKEYVAYRFALDGKNIVYREGKITPTKAGHFVTTWKRPEKEIIPFNLADPIDFLIITVSEGDHCGQFIFPRDLLISKGILASATKPGKLSFRLYAPWVIPTSPTAKKSQSWQVKYFFTPDTLELAKDLFYELKISI
ncbi:MAG: MepB family protein [Simkaniaceae bacterium]|nr:MepB family protein [Simkaniaceae bacterium]